MKKIFVGLCLVFSMVAKAGDDVILSLGEEKSVPFTGGRVWISAPQIVQAQVSGRNLKVKALREGSVEIRFGSSSRKVFVWTSMQTQAFQNMRAIVRRLPGLEVQPGPKGPRLTGRIYRFEDLQNLSRRMENDGAWFLESQLTPLLRRQLQTEIDRRLRQAQLPPQPLLFRQNVEIHTLGTEEMLRSLRQVVTPWGIAVIKDENAVELGPVVRVEIAVAEIRKDLMRKVGIKWPAAAEAKLLPGTGWSSSELLFEAHAFESSGLGRLLARPNLICRSGKEAEFLAGGEFPIKMLNYRTQDVVWKRYGILLKVKPKADASGRMSLQLETEVSSIDPSRTVDGVPGLLTNRVSSYFDLSRPRTIALSGLLKKEASESREGLPWLSGIPILGNLFSSRDWRDNRTELVIFVRPEVQQEVSNEDEP